MQINVDVPINDADIIQNQWDYSSWKWSYSASQIEKDWAEIDNAMHNFIFILSSTVMN